MHQAQATWGEVPALPAALLHHEACERECVGQGPGTRQMVTMAVKSSLSLIGVDTTHFSCLSMRRGGISAALTAKVQAPVLYLQSGHGSENAAFNYVVPVDPSVWYESFAAFGL